MNVYSQFLGLIAGKPPLYGTVSSAPLNGKVSVDLADGGTAQFFGSASIGQVVMVDQTKIIGSIPALTIQSLTI